MKQNRCTDWYRFDRLQGRYSSTIKDAKYCSSCRETTTADACPKCKKETIKLDLRARIPRKSASERKWKQFHEKFVFPIEQRRREQMEFT